MQNGELVIFDVGCEKNSYVSDVGRTFPVLFEKAGRQDGQMIGRSPYLQHVSAVGTTDLVGKIRSVAISSASSYSLAGVVMG